MKPNSIGSPDSSAGPSTPPPAGVPEGGPLASLQLYKLTKPAHHPAGLTAEACLFTFQYRCLAVLPWQQLPSSALIFVVCVATELNVIA